MRWLVLLTCVGGCGGSDSAAVTGGTEAGAEAATGPGPGASCSDVSGAWKVTTLRCNDKALDLIADGIEVTFDFASSTAGTVTTKFFTPSGQSATWCARSNGLSVTYGSGSVTWTDTAPVEACSTETKPNADWSCTIRGNTDTCTHSTGTPGTPDASTYTCSATASTLTLTRTSDGSGGPCPAGQSEEATLTKQ